VVRPPPTRPGEIEQSLLGRIPLPADKEHLKQSSLVGDPYVIFEFHQTLRQMGKMTEGRGGRIVHLSEKRQLRILKKIAQSRGINAQIIFILLVRRRKYFSLGSPHRLAIVAVDTDEKVTSSRKQDALYFAQVLEQRGHLDKKSRQIVEQGTIPNNWPLILKTSVPLGEIVLRYQLNLSEYNRRMQQLASKAEE